jgi:hypothetical protein
MASATAMTASRIGIMILPVELMLRGHRHPS